MIVIKIGGSIVNDLNSSAIKDIHNILSSEKLLLVHGGGKEVTSIATRLGKEQRFIVSPGGIRSRYTDKETAEIYTMVMSGKINKLIVKMLLKEEIRAVGLSGIDNHILGAIRKTKLTVINEKGRKMVIDGGYTGKIKTVGTELLNLLLNEGYVPVISPVALSEEFDFLNVDGDRAAAYIAGNLGADKVIFITNVPSGNQDFLFSDITFPRLYLTILPSAPPTPTNIKFTCYSSLTSDIPLSFKAFPF
jgi:acetylglutamate/LysW-gamma-L-alpha-aminoadipate kinase